MYTLSLYNKTCILFALFLSHAHIHIRYWIKNKKGEIEQEVSVDSVTAQVAKGAASVSFVEIQSPKESSTRYKILMSTFFH